ncbi:Ref family protein [Mycetohabitans sp. B8]|uniref:Ref family recombination enhancement nuclease n=1 Tax=Mycetohabitans sp. B8 TaxID=2841845 RepID=UPI001F1CF804|nr:Ref family recombination enhancement nuclease [Mycetohabitans sp. B8]MCG1042519.1 Ref family protein [Mycetohabitans sp. B8]
MTRSEADYLDKVARLGCAACALLGYEVSDVQPEIHHPREGQGTAQRAPHWLAVPLCPQHHRGTNGIHGNRQVLRQLKCDEWDLLAWVISRLN